MTEDLGIKIVSKEQAIWEEVLKGSKTFLEVTAKEVIVQTAMKEMAQSKIDSLSKKA